MRSELIDLQKALDELADTDVVGLLDDDVRTALPALLTAFNQLSALIATVVASFDTRSLSEVDGFRTTVAWLVAFGRMTPGAGAGWLTRGRLLRELPALASAAAHGDVSTDHLTRVADLARRLDLPTVKEFDTILADLAATARPADVTKACDRIAAHKDPDGKPPDPERDFERREFTMSRRGSMFALRGQLDLEGGATLITAIDALMKPPPPTDPRTAPQRRADALVELARLGTSASLLPTVGGVRPSLGILITPETLLDIRMHAAGFTAADGPPDATPDATVDADRTPWQPPPPTLAGGTWPVGISLDAAADAGYGLILPGAIGTATAGDGPILPGATQTASASAELNLPAAEPTGPSSYVILPGTERTSLGRLIVPGRAQTTDPPDATEDEPPPVGHHQPRPTTTGRSGGAQQRLRRQDALAAAGVPDLPDAAWLNWAGEIPTAMAQRLACDCDVWRIVLDPATGLPLEVGRAHRLVPHWMRKALHARDRGCRWPGCAAPVSWTDAHHLIWWFLGGRTDIDQLVSLCRWHHVKVHEGQWAVRLDPATGEVHVTRPDGTPYELGPSQPHITPTRARAA